jgi:hypothetical protein
MVAAAARRFKMKKGGLIANRGACHLFILS